MSMKTTCVGCGEDCSHAYGTWRGYPFHFACIPSAQWKAAATEDDLEQLDGMLDDRAREN